MTDQTTLSFSRTLAASPAQVWRCWTEPELIKQWFAPSPVTTTEAEIDARPGGIFRTVMIVPEIGEMRGQPGCILLALPQERLVWTNALGPEFQPNRIGSGPHDFAFSADIQLTADGDHCRYTATVRHADAAGAKVHEEMGFYDGWGTAAEQLGALAATV